MVGFGLDLLSVKPVIEDEFKLAGTGSAMLDDDFLLAMRSEFGFRESDVEHVAMFKRDTYDFDSAVGFSSILVV